MDLLADPGSAKPEELDDVAQWVPTEIIREAAGLAAADSPPDDGRTVMESSSTAACETNDGGAKREDGRAASTPANDRDMGLPKLGPHDRQAYQLWTLQGWTQQQIADELNRQHGTTYSQGRISRMIKRAQIHWKTSGLSDLIPDPPKPAKPMDPAKLDMGRRTDGRTRSQRDKHSPGAE